MQTAHCVMVVPGLGGEHFGLQKILDSWTQFGLTTLIHDMHWKDNTTTYIKEEAMLIDRIDELSSGNAKISLVGMSAGGSAVINAFAKRKNTIHRVVNICGRLHTGRDVHPALDFASRQSPAFKESVLQCEKNLATLTPHERLRILTMAPLFNEVVPVSTIPVAGAFNTRLFCVEHMLSICVALTFYRSFIISFLNNNSRLA